MGGICSLGKLVGTKETFNRLSSRDLSAGWALDRRRQVSGDAI
jgi:hypothetical protein